MKTLLILLIFSLIAMALIIIVHLSRQAESPVIFITIDTLRADHLGCYGYFRDTSPNIDRLADDSVRFTQATTTMSTTLPAHTSLMTSSYPVRHGVLSNLEFYRQPVVTNPRFRTAAQMFRQEGHRTGAFVSAAVLRAETGIAIGFDTYDEPEETSRVAEATVERAIAWLETQENDRFFLWIHLFDPHDPYRAPPPYLDMYEMEERQEAFIRERGVPDGNVRWAQHLNNRYDGEIRYADEQVGRFLDRLREQDLYERSLIVLTSDHGEGLLQHEEMWHGPIFNEELDIPLIVKFPKEYRRAGHVVDGLTSLIDLLPMITEELDLPLDRAQFDGRNPLRSDPDFILAQRERTEGRYGSDDNHIIRDRRWKYFYYTESRDTLFDLENDYHELDDVIDHHPEIAGNMRRRLLELLAQHRERGSDLEVNQDIPPALREEIESLGYVD